MKALIYTLMLIPIFAAAQPINQTDDKGLKQGFWRTHDQHGYQATVGAYKNGKKLGMWLTMDSAYNRASFLCSEKLYSSDTLLEHKRYERGTDMEYYLSYHMRLNTERDTLCIEYLEPGTEQVFLGKSFITAFSMADYFNYQELTIPAIPSYCLHKNYSESYYTHKRVYVHHGYPDRDVAKEVYESDRGANFYRSSLYDSTGMILSSEKHIRPIEIDRHTSNVVYMNGKRIALTDQEASDYPKYHYTTQYKKGKVSYSKTSLSKGEKFYDSSFSYNEQGKITDIFISTLDTSYGLLFYPSGKLKCSSFSNAQGFFEVCYYESGKLIGDRKYGAVTGKETWVCYFENGKKSYIYKEKKTGITSMNFDANGRITCSFKRKNDYVKTLEYINGKKVVKRFRSSLDLGDLTAMSHCRCDAKYQ